MAHLVHTKVSTATLRLPRAGELLNLPGPIAGAVGPAFACSAFGPEEVSASACPDEDALQVRVVDLEWKDGGYQTKWVGASGGKQKRTFRHLTTTMVRDNMRVSAAVDVVHVLFCSLIPRSLISCSCAPATTWDRWLPTCCAI